MRNKILILFIATLFCNVSVFPLSANKEKSPASKELCGLGNKKGCKVLYMGDSITDGFWGAKDGKQTSERRLWDMNHIYGHGYVFVCAAHYMSLYPEQQYQFYNRGISGDDLDKMEKRWKTDVLDMNPDILSVFIGTNDVGHYLASTREKPFDFIAWDKKYRDLLDQAKAANPSVKIVLATPFVAKVGKVGASTDFPLRKEMVEKLAAIITKIAADYHAVYVPYDKLVRETIAKYPNLPEDYWIWDGIHPTAQMHQLMAEMWMKATRVK
jgi:lysophospholipase L1-like esterase